MGTAILTRSAGTALFTLNSIQHQYSQVLTDSGAFNYSWTSTFKGYALIWAMNKSYSSATKFYMPTVKVNDSQSTFESMQELTFDHGSGQAARNAKAVFVTCPIKIGDVINISWSAAAGYPAAYVVVFKLGS